MIYKNGIIPGRPLKSWQGYISQDESVIQKIDSLFPKNHFIDPKLGPKSSKNNTPPVLVYKEITDEEGYTVETYYSNPGNLQAQRGFSINRELIQTSLSNVGAQSRGIILSAFCEIEFLLDVLVCLGMGVYEGRTSYKKVKSLYKYDCENKLVLPDTESRIDYLLHKKLIRPETAKYLKLAKKVRNTLAHQYMPSSTVGLTPAELVGYENIGEAVYSIYNTAWFYLLCDYVPQQEVVIDWLSTQKA